MCGVVLRGGQEAYREGRAGPQPPIPSSFPRPRSTALQRRRPGPKGMRGAGPTSWPRASHSLDAFHSGPLQELHLALGEPRRFGSHREPQVSPQGLATVSWQAGALGPDPRQPDPESPVGHPPPGLGPASPPARFPSTHRPAALGAPASGRQGPAGTGAGPPRARGALRGRADAVARSRPRSRTDPPPHTHTHRRTARAGPARRRTRAREPEESLE